MTPAQLMKAVRYKKSLIAFPMGRQPAAFIANMQFSRVMMLLPTMVVYQPRKNKFTKSPWERKSNRRKFIETEIINEK